jgi:DNA-binding response OmpR family regulator
LLQPLAGDPRIEVFVTGALTKDWVCFAERVAAGVLLCATDDPLAALVYARTAGIRGHVMLTIDRAHENECAELEAIGDVSCIAVPLHADSSERIVSVLGARQSLASVCQPLHLLLDPIGRSVRHGDASVRLSQREFALLHCLSLRSGRPVRSSEILNYVWDNASTLRSAQIVDVYVCQVRRKLRRIGLDRAIRTIRNYGYAIENTIVSPVATVATFFVF